jgi:hypothetical protein
VTKLLATSVVRGSVQGESHGGVFLIDLDAETVEQKLDWDTADIEWEGRGWDRGLRGIAFSDDAVLIAASAELYVFAPDFASRHAFANPYLHHAHEISRWRHMTYVTSTGFDAILGFDLSAGAFTFGLSLNAESERIGWRTFDPRAADGPARSNSFHLNSITATDYGLFIAGLNTPGLLRFDGKALAVVASLPGGTHNAQPLANGLLFNDTRANLVRHVTPARQRQFFVPSYDEKTLTHLDAGRSGIARQAFARGLCTIGETMVAGGSSPSTIALHDLAANKTVRVITLSNDIRNAIHGLEVWPFD